MHPSQRLGAPPEQRRLRRLHRHWPRRQVRGHPPEKSAPACCRSGALAEPHQSNDHVASQRLLLHPSGLSGQFGIGTLAGGSIALPRIKSAARSAIMIVVALVLTLTTLGMTEASTTRRPSTPRTRSSVSTTACGS